MLAASDRMEHGLVAPVQLTTLAGESLHLLSSSCPTFAMVTLGACEAEDEMEVVARGATSWFVGMNGLDRSILAIGLYRVVYAFLHDNARPFGMTRREGNEHAFTHTHSWMKPSL
eukprot:m.294421 g.294421  ORF g.294421 m.294421 type:complete len:115 (+) comp15849_c1_seq6:4640-4984(+)